MSMLDRLDKRIAEIDAEIARVQAQAAESIRELRGSRAGLVQMRVALEGKPEYEQLIALAKANGLL